MINAEEDNIVDIDTTKSGTSEVNEEALRGEGQVMSPRGMGEVEVPASLANQAVEEPVVTEDEDGDPVEA